VKTSTIRTLAISVFVLLHFVAVLHHGSQLWSDGRWVSSLLQVAVLMYLWARTGGHSSGLAIFGVYDVDDESGKFWGDALATFGLACSLYFQFG
jgi:hypothetical protein